MAKLQQYNTLAEAIAFNLSKENIEELGLLDYNGYNKSTGFPSKHSITPTKNVFFRRGLYDEINNSYDLRQAEFDTTDNIIGIEERNYYILSVSSLKYGSISKEIDLASSNKFINGDSSRAGVVNGTMVGVGICTVSGKIPFFGNFMGDKAGGYSIYSSFSNAFIGKLDLRTKIAEDGSYYYSPITDFRYMPNKKIIKMTELINNSFFKMLNLVPNNTIGFLFQDEAETDDTLYKQFVDDICKGQEIISSYDNLVKFEKKYYRKYTIFFRTSNAIYFGNFNDCSIMAMFVNDNKLNYPLNENGYIDYKNIDYSKEYTSGLGSARVNPKIITKMLGWTWTPAKPFTNEPDPDLQDQGTKTNISISKQVFRPSENTATLTITLGHCIVDGSKYYDKLGTIHSKNELIKITKNNDETYKINFKDTTKPQTDFIYIPVKNTFNNITLNNFYELELVEDNITEVIRTRQSSYNVTVSNCNTISGYIFYERKEELTEEEKNNLKQANIDTAFKFLNDNIVSFTRLSPFDPTDIKSITFTSREILCIFKGKTLAKSEQYREGKYHYDIQTIKSKIATTLDITLESDTISPTINPSSGNTPKNKPIKPSGYRPLGSGSGSGSGSGGNGSNNNPPSSNFTEDDTEEIPERDLNEDGVKEAITIPDNSYSCNIPKTNNDFADITDYLIFVKKEITTDPIYTDESLIGAGREGDGSIILSKNYQDGYVWTYPENSDNSGVKLGTIYTNASYLMPKITTTLTYKVKYRKPDSNGDSVDENSDRYISFSFWQYAQDFIEVANYSEKNGTEIKGGKESSYFANISSIGKTNWNKYNPDNHEFTEDDFKYEFNGEDVKVSMKWKFQGVGLAPSEGYFSVRDVFNICIYMEGLTEEELRKLYNVPEDDNIKIVEAPKDSVIDDENNFKIVFSTTNDYNYLGINFNFEDTTKKTVYGTYDLKVTLTDSSELVYTKDFKNMSMRINGNQNIAFSNNEIQTSTNQKFDVTNITNVKFEILEKRDFMDSIIPNKEKTNENT